MPVNAVRMSAGVSADKGMRSRLTDLQKGSYIKVSMGRAFEGNFRKARDNNNLSLRLARSC